MNLIIGLTILFLVFQYGSFEEINDENNTKCLFSLHSLQCSHETTNDYYDQYISTGFDQELRTISCRNCNLSSLEEYMFSKNPKWSLNLQHIEVTSNKQHLQLLETPFRGLDALHWLKLYNSQITDISSNTFEGIPNLKYLFLQDNNLTVLPARVFSEIAHVQKINLNNNQIKNIHKTAFHDLIDLKELLLAGNEIKRFKDDTFETLKMLRAVDLSSNPFAYLNFEQLHDSLEAIEVIRIQDIPCRTLVDTILKNVHNTYDINTYSAKCNFNRSDLCLFVKIIKKETGKEVVISTVKESEDNDSISLDKIGDIPCQRRHRK